VNCNVIDQVFIRDLDSRQIVEEKLEYNGTINQLFIDFEKAYDTVTREMLWE
jgi:hypothetical protein